MTTVPDHFLPDLRRFPDGISMVEEGEHFPQTLAQTRSDGSRWEGSGASVALQIDALGSLSVEVEAPARALRRVVITWSHFFSPGTLLLGDAWERSYGDLGWWGFSIPREMPWYFLATDGTRTAGCGVATGAGSMASWRILPHEVALHLDLRSGGVGVRLGNRVLHAAKVISRPPHDGESPFQAAGHLCGALCSSPLLPKEPVIGHNDWYWLYGKNSEALILEATRRFVDLYPSDSPVRPWSVIDDGWQAEPEQWAQCNGGPWEQGNTAFPDMGLLASKMRDLGARPGIWLRPLLTRAAVPEEWKLRRPFPSSQIVPLDPSVPDVLDLVRTDISRLCAWGYELIKYDFSTFDVTGCWGLTMQGGFSPDGWQFSDNSRTTAEILVNFYRAIREAAKEKALLIGCNVVGHLAAGLVEIQRTGDDTSAHDWDRTRRMGVNTLAFRLPQHGRFFAIDADCVPVSPHIPPEKTLAWLDLVARSGTPTFLSLDPRALGSQETAGIRQALQQAIRTAEATEPLDWLYNSFPSQWKFQEAITTFQW